MPCTTTFQDNTRLFIRFPLSMDYATNVCPTRPRVTKNSCFTEYRLDLDVVVEMFACVWCITIMCKTEVGICREGGQVVERKRVIPVYHCILAWNSKEFENSEF